MSMTSKDLAYLAKDAYEDRSREAAIEGESIQIGGRVYGVIAHVSRPSGYQGTAYRDKASGDVVIAHRGTEFDLLSPQFLRDVVRADGGMVAKSVNAQVPDAIEFTSSVSESLRKRAEERGESPPSITLTGHSLGGAIAQVDAHHHGLRTETFNAYGAAELAGMQAAPARGAQAINHVDAADFVSSGSRHFGEVRVYATEADIAHLRQHGYGQGPLIPNGPMPVAAAAVAGRINALADTVAGPSPTTAALSDHGFGAHRIAKMAPDAGISLLSEDNRKRYEDNRTLVDDYRGDIHGIRLGISAHAKEWPDAVAAVGAVARHSSNLMEAAGVVQTMIREAREVPMRLGRAAVEGLQEFGRDALTQPQAASASPYLLGKVGSPAAPSARATDDDRRLQTYLDPGHPDRPLFRMLRDRLPQEIGDEKVAELTLAARRGGVRADEAVTVQMHGERVFVAGRVPGDRAHVDLDRPAPPLEETMRQAQAFERQQVQQQEHVQAQQRGHGGPAMSGP